MPRKSAAALATEVVIRPSAPPPPPEPPAELTPEQAKIWREIVACRPPEFFDGACHALLVSYCRHVATADFVASAINSLDASDPKEFRIYARLLSMATRESKMIASLSTKLRLAPSNVRRIEQNVPTPRKPLWERHI